MEKTERAQEALAISPRERVLRLVALMVRARAFARGGAIVAVLVTLAGATAAWRMPHVYESETVLLVRDAIRADARDDTPSVRTQRLGPKLKELLLSRPRLEKIITELGLFAPVVEERGLVEAVEEMRLHIGFRARDSDTFLVSYQADTADLAQRVTLRLAQSMIEDFVADSVDRTSQTRDFLVEEERHADEELEEKSRDLATFMAEHPEFAWDKVAGAGQGAGLLGASAPLRAKVPAHGGGRADPELAALYRERARLEAALGPSKGSARGGGVDALPAQKSLEEVRAKAALALEAAQVDLAEKRQRLTEQHPDVMAARARAVSLGRAVGVAEMALAEANARTLERAAEGEAADSSDDGTIRQKLAHVRAAIAEREQGRSPPRAGAPASSASSPGVSAPPPTASPAVLLEATWQRVLRDLEDARRHKEDVTEKKNRAELTASAAASSEDSMMTVIDPAFRPSHPIKPNRALVAGLSGATGVLLGVLFALGGVLLGDAIVDAGDIESLRRAEVLASLPRERPPANARGTAALSRPAGKGVARDDASPPPAVRRSTLSGAGQALALVRACAPHPLTIEIDGAQAEQADPVVLPPFVIVGETTSSATLHLREGALLGPPSLAALRLLRRRIERWASRHAVLGILSAERGEGKSRIAAQLALALSESARARVLLVEANLERPSLARLLSLPIPPGESLSYQLARRSGGASERPWAVVSAGPTLHVLAEREGDGSKPSLLHSHQFAAAVDELRGAYDYVVIDGPSVLEEGHAGSVEAVCDAVMLVARSSVSKKSALSRALSSLGGAFVLGVVLTDVNAGDKAS